MLYISADIRNLATKVKRDTTKNLLDWLKTQYSTTSISATYSDIITVDKLRIPGDYDPTSTLDKLLSLFMCLEDNKLIYTEAICVMTLLMKLLSQIKEIMQSYHHRWKRLCKATTVDKRYHAKLQFKVLRCFLSFAAIHNDVILNWQQHSSMSQQNKLSTGKKRERQKDFFKM